MLHVKKAYKEQKEKQTKPENTSLVYFGGLCICAHISHLQFPLEIHTDRVKPLSYSTRLPEIIPMQACCIKSPGPHTAVRCVRKRCMSSQKTGTSSEGATSHPSLQAPLYNSLRTIFWQNEKLAVNSVIHI